MYFVAYIFIQLGCIALSLILPKHYKLFFDRKSLNQKKKTAFNVLGYGLLFIGLLVCASINPFAVALTVFFGLLTVAIFVWALLMGYKAQK